MTKNLTLAAGYIRMSSDDQQHSPDRQKSEINKLAKREGCQIIAFYEDLGMTGTESAKRKGFQKMLVDAKAGRFKAVLMYEQSRMSREDPLDALEHLRQLRDAGVMLYTCQRGRIDTTNIAGLLLAVVESHGAHEESRKISARSLSGKIERIKAGHRQGGAVLGYDRVMFDERGREARRIVGVEKFRKPVSWTVKLEPSSNKKAVETVRFIFKKASAGLPHCRIARELNMAGMTTNFGKSWCANDVSRVVVNRVYCGDLFYGRKRRGKFNSILDSGEALLVQDTHQHLVPRETWERANRQEKRRERPPRAPRQPGRYLLSGGLMECVTNNVKLYGLSVRQHRRYVGHSVYYEKNPGAHSYSYDADVIEEGVVNAVIRAFDGKALEEARRAITKRERKDATAEAKIEDELAIVRQRIERAVDNITIAAAADVPGMSRRLAEFRQREAEVLAQLHALRGASPPTPDAVQLIGKLWKLLPTLGKSNRPEHRELLAHALRKTISKVTLRTVFHDGPLRMERVRTWSGVIEFHPAFQRPPVELTDDDIPTPYKWRMVLPVLREAGRAMVLGEVAEALYGAKYGKTEHIKTSFMLRQAAATGRIEKLGHGKGWVFRR